MADAVPEVKGEMRAIGSLFVLVLLAAGAWTGAWFYAAHAAARAFDAWVGRQAAQGGVWTCPARRIEGFPLSLEIACDHPTFAGLALGEQAAVTVAAARIHVDLRDLHRASLHLQAPMTFRSESGATDFVATWNRLDLDIDGVPDAVTSGTLSGAAVAAHGQFGGADMVVQPVGKLDIALASVASVDPTLDFSVAAEGAVVPALDRALGDVQSVASILTGRLTQAVFEDAETPAALMENWRQRGGTISFSSAQLSRGTSRAEATGSLRLDEAHRIEGRLDASFAGAGPILHRFGINPNLLAAGSILTSLFGKRDAAKPARDPDAIRLPLQFRDGRLGVGPVTTGVKLSPLY